MKSKYLIFLFSSCYDKWDKIDELIYNSEVDILKVKKNIQLSNVGKFNLIKNIYANEEWLGDELDNYDGLYYKLNSCFADSNDKVNIYSVFAKEETILNIKNTVRKVCNIGNHSIHTTDKDEDIDNLEKSYFNDNTINYLNIIRDINQSNFLYLFQKLEKFFRDNNLDKNKICISGSSVLSIYNLRDCYDIDYFLLSDKIVSKIDDKIECYNDYFLKNNFDDSLNINVEEIFSNENYYFYYNGFKVMKLDILKRMKELRNEEKDIKDIALIDKVILNEYYKD